MKKILFVDDETYSIEPYLDYLKSDAVGREVQHIHSYSNALEAIMTRAPEYSSIILDVRIKPGREGNSTNEDFQIAGIRLYRQLRKLHPKAKVAILTHNFQNVPLDEIAADKYAIAVDKAQYKPDELWRKIKELEQK